MQLLVRLLERQTALLQAKIGQLENGLDRLGVAAFQVDDVKEVLAVQEVELIEKTEDEQQQQDDKLWPVPNTMPI